MVLAMAPPPLLRAKERAKTATAVTMKHYHVFHCDCFVAITSASVTAMPLCCYASINATATYCHFHHDRGEFLSRSTFKV